MTSQLTDKRYFGLGQVPIGIGAVFHGREISEEDVKNSTMPFVVDFRAMTPKCPHNCYPCFTNKMKKDLTLDEIKKVIDQLSELGVVGIDYLGEGEPTFDPDFFPIIEYTSSKGIVPIVFTEASHKMRDIEYIKRVFDSEASVAPKLDSLYNEDYQNWIVRDRRGRYFKERNEALQLLVDFGFNKVMANGSTRLGFDMVVSSKNINEVERTLRYCRDNNIWIGFSTFLPTGRSGSEGFDKSLKLNEKDLSNLAETVRRVDEKYGFNHRIYNNFFTTPCLEFMQIFGNGSVSPCPGNDRIIGNIRTHSIRELQKIIYESYPCHNPQTFEGDCLYRPLVQIQ